MTVFDGRCEWWLIGLLVSFTLSVGGITTMFSGQWLTGVLAFVLGVVLQVLCKIQMTRRIEARAKGHT